MKYPIGIQQFEEIRTGGWVYVDKTAQVYNLAKEGKYFFLSRPRRFGKSLLLSTLQAYFEGKKHLFEGLAIERLETEWNAHPVLHLDLNAEQYNKIDDLRNILDTYLREWEREYGTTEESNPSLSQRFRGVIRAAKQKTGRNVVVLVDEYDKPMLQAIGNEELQTEFRNALKAFYGVLKSADGDLRFAMLTGVTKFSKVSVFSDLNNLKDISMSPHYHDICGITEKELQATFDAEVEKLAQVNEQTKEEAYLELQRRYDGYHFCGNSTGMYNPFSLLWTLSEQRYGSYWFSTGTPTYLVELMKEVNLNPKELSGYEADASELDSIQIKVDNPIAILYQSGYLTIKDYNPEFNVYVLDYPNEEVKEGFHYLTKYVERKTMFSEFSYRKLRVYKQSKDLVVYIYGLIRHFPKEENFALCDQLRRAAISIPSNIAEGMGRNSYKEQIHFLEISYGSLNEVMCQIEIAYELRFVTLEQLQKVEELYRGIAQMLSGLRKSRMSTFNSD